jgi:hypothetical protein
MPPATKAASITPKPDAPEEKEEITQQEERQKQIQARELTAGQPGTPQKLRRRRRRRRRKS